MAGRLGASTELVVVSTRGDRDTSSTIHALGGTGVFVKEVQDAVLRGDADLAVHSAKDLPAETPDGLVLAAVPERGDPRDALGGVPRSTTCPTGGHVGTGSVRRRAQLAALRPDLTFGELRGNIPTRLEKAADFDAVVVAAAALDRLDVADRIDERLEPATLLPAGRSGRARGGVPGRRRRDARRAGRDQRRDRARRGPRRARVPLPARWRLQPPVRSPGPGGPDRATAPSARAGAVVLVLDALLASLDGRIVLRVQGTGSDPEALGADVARRLLDDEGGSILLDALGLEPGLARQ